MSLIRLYVIAYFVLLGGALVALWQAGLLGQIPLLWLALGLIVAVGLGILLAVTSTRPPVKLE